VKTRTELKWMVSPPPESIPLDGPWLFTRWAWLPSYRRVVVVRHYERGGTFRVVPKGRRDLWLFDLSAEGEARLVLSTPVVSFAEVERCAVELAAWEPHTGVDTPLESAKTQV
jgi:hypothetical protein